MIREGDILVPLIGRRLTARVAEGPDVGAYLSSTVFLIRPDAETIDPWFLAGLLSSSGGGRQSARMASAIGDNIHFEPRRVRVPLLPIEDTARLRRDLPPHLGLHPHPPRRLRRGHRLRQGHDRRHRLFHGESIERRASAWLRVPADRRHSAFRLAPVLVWAVAACVAR